jgi:Zn-dependent protease
MFSGFLDRLPSMLLSLPVIFLALSFHEMCHAYAAYRLGDPTARNFGRLTLNPMKHINPLGFLCMVLFRFGWANPVPINARNFKNPRRDMALSALAGPVSNVILGIVSAILLRLSLIGVEHYFAKDIEAIYTSIITQSHAAVSKPFLMVAIVVMMIYLSVLINFSYAVFNFIPVPPLDGSRIFYILLPPKWYFGIMKYERIIMYVMLALLWTGALTLPLNWIVGGMESGIFTLLGMGGESGPRFTLLLIEYLISSFL